MRQRLCCAIVAVLLLTAACTSTHGARSIQAGTPTTHLSSARAGWCAQLQRVAVTTAPVGFVKLAQGQDHGLPCYGLSYIAPIVFPQKLTMLQDNGFELAYELEWWSEQQKSDLVLITFKFNSETGAAAYLNFRTKWLRLPSSGVEVDTSLIPDSYGAVETLGGRSDAVIVARVRDIVLVAHCHDETSAQGAVDYTLDLAKTQYARLVHS